MDHKPSSAATPEAFTLYGLLMSAFRASTVTPQEERTACLFAMLPASRNGACMLNNAFFSTQVLLAKGAVSKLTQACT